MTNVEFEALCRHLYGPLHFRARIADALGIGRTTVSRYIAGKAPVPKVVVLALQTLGQIREGEAVYVVSSTLTDRKYYGVSVSPWARWRQHQVSARTERDLPLYAAMRELGAESFSMTVLAYFDDRASALAEEERLIAAALKAGERPYNFAPGSAWSQKSADDELRSELTEMIVRCGSMRALCRRHGLNISSVSRFLSGHRRPSTEVMTLLGKINRV